MKCWVNGVFFRHLDDHISLSDRGLLLGDGLFETILVKKGQPCFWHEHYTRLERASAQFKMAVPFSPSTILSALKELISAQGNQAVDYAARITLTSGRGLRGIIRPEGQELQPTLFMTVAPLPPSAHGTAKLFLSSVRRNEGSPLSRLKAIAYGDNIAAREEAIRAGFDDALMLNNREHVCCVSVGNIFVLRQETLLTPAIDEGVLPGIVRTVVLDLAREMDLKVEERGFGIKALEGGLVFSTNSLQGLRRCKYGEEAFDQDLRQEENILQALKQRYERRLTMQSEGMNG